jgi:hypothetical protein
MFKALCVRVWRPIRRSESGAGDGEPRRLVAVVHGCESAGESDRLVFTLGGNVVTHTMFSTSYENSSSVESYCRKLDG